MSAAAGRGDATKIVNMRRVHAPSYPITLRSTIAPKRFSRPGFVAHMSFALHALRERITTASVALTMTARYSGPRVVATMYGCS
jgi:hypothetical protein